MTYEESDALSKDFVFQGRVKIACLKYADSILGEANTVPAHNTREKWAFNTMQNPQFVAAQVQPPVVMDAAVQAAGAAITDEALQGAVESVVNKLL